MRSAYVPLVAISLILSGCSMFGHHEPRIAAKGDVVAQGRGQLSFRSPGPGLVSVFDVNANSVVSSSAVEAGTIVAVNPTAQTITVTDASRAGTQVVNTGVNQSHRYEIWFIPQEQVDAGVLRQPVTTAPSN